MKFINYFKIIKYINWRALGPSYFKNRLKLILSYNKKSATVAGFPIILQIELSNRCNLNCIMCPRQNMKRIMGDMELELFKKTIDQAKGKSEVIILHFMGESLLNSHIFEMISCCRNANIRTVLSTNGTLLNEEAAKKIIQSKLDILLLPFDGADKETFEKVRRGANFEKVLENIENFLAMKKNLAPFTIIQLIEMQETYKGKQEFLKRWNNYRNVTTLIKPFTRWQGDLETINKLDLERVKQVGANKLCDRAWMWATICQDGEIVPCCRDYDAIHKLGNLKERKMTDIWNGEKMLEFRDKHLSGRDNVDICRECDYNPFLYTSSLAKFGLLLIGMYPLTRALYDLKYNRDQELF